MGATSIFLFLSVFFFLSVKSSCPKDLAQCKWTGSVNLCGEKEHITAITFVHEEETQLLISCACSNCRKMKILPSDLTISRISWWEFVVRVLCKSIEQDDDGFCGHTC